MDAKIKEDLLKALRSGEYKQAKGILKSRKRAHFCCLGVLCDIQGINWSAINTEDLITSNVPEEYAAGLSDTEQSNLADLNDAGSTFAEIADRIEGEL